MVNEERRSLLRWAVHGLGALFAFVLGIPAVAYLIDGRNRAAPNRGFRKIHGVNLDALQAGQPVQAVIRDVRRDAWNISEDVIGRVWVVKLPTGDIKVFTTICPHLGCSVNLDPQPQTGFTCPCHGAKFMPDGKLDTRVARNPAPRAMDVLEWRRDPNDPAGLEVRYQNFYQGRHEKVAKT
jgi:Rieske Fe-S protein